MADTGAPIASLGLTLFPITLKQAEPFERRVHRHLPPPQGGRFAIGLKRGDELVGVAIVGNPARVLIGSTRGGPWSRPSRHRDDKHPLGKKLRWRKAA